MFLGEAYDSYGFENPDFASDVFATGIEGAPEGSEETEADEVVKLHSFPTAVGVTINGLVINRKITKVNFNRLSNKRNTYLVIHYVGAESSAAANANYFYNVDRGASAHYFVDETSIWQVVEDNDMAWHVGAKYYKHPYCRNSNSIGIELCVKRDSNGDWYYEDKTIENGIALARYICDKYNIPETNVIRHYDVTGKICGEPHVRKESTWIDFKKRVFQISEPVEEDDEMVETINAQINGKDIEADAIVKNGVTFMAIRALKAAGFDVEYNNETKLRIIKNKINEVPVKVDDNETIKLNAINVENTNYVKIRDTAAALNCKSIDYDTETGTIIIKTK